MVITDFTFFLFTCPTAVRTKRTPTDWTDSRTFILVLVLVRVLQAWLASFRSLREREFYQAWQASPLPETVRTGNLKLHPTTPDHTLHDMTCRPVSVQLYSPPPPLVTLTATYIYDFCAGIYEVERLKCAR